jgi:hypothetical protein
MSSSCSAVECAHPTGPAWSRPMLGAGWLWAVKGAAKAAQPRAHTSQRTFARNYNTPAQRFPELAGVPCRGLGGTRAEGGVSHPF